MKTKLWELRAIDTLFFRDGTPHNAGEGGGVSIKSIFPPYMLTLQGAVRTSLAMGQGWEPKGDLPFPEELGDSQNFGKVSFEGPYLKSGKEYLFPVPLNLLKGQEEEFSFLRPTTEPIKTDMGNIRIPKLERAIDGAKTMDAFLVKASVLERILQGDNSDFAQDDFEEKAKLWELEDRAGIAIESSTRAAKDAMLYFTSHIRAKQEVAITVKVKGLDNSWHDKVPSVLSLGGEGRMAAVDIREDEDVLPKMPSLRIRNNKIRFTITLITPGCIWPFIKTKDISYGMGSLIKNGYSFIPGKCVSACIGKLKQLGGFDMVMREPRPLMPIIPAGSIWFYEGDMEDIPALERLHGKVNNPLGFNQILIGNWGD